MKFVVWDVFYLNREESPHDQLIVGAKFYVGDSPVPTQNTPCPDEPTDTGLYSCNGLKGYYFFIHKNVAGLPDKRLIICGLQAYSTKANYFPGNQPSICVIPPEANELLDAFNYPYGPRKQTAGYGFKWDSEPNLYQVSFTDTESGFLRPRTYGPLLLMKFPNHWPRNVSMTFLWHPYPDSFHTTALYSTNTQPIVRIYPQRDTTAPMDCSVAPHFGPQQLVTTFQDPALCGGSWSCTLTTISPFNESAQAWGFSISTKTSLQGILLHTLHPNCFDVSKRNTPINNNHEFYTTTTVTWRYEIKELPPGATCPLTNFVSAETCDFLGSQGPGCLTAMPPSIRYNDLTNDLTITIDQTITTSVTHRLVLVGNTLYSAKSTTHHFGWYSHLNVQIIIFNWINFAATSQTENKSDGMASSFTLPKVNSSPSGVNYALLTYTVTGAPSFFSFGPEKYIFERKTCNLSASVYPGAWTLIITATFTGHYTKTATMTVYLNTYACLSSFTLSKSSLTVAILAILSAQPTTILTASPVNSNCGGYTISFPSSPALLTKSGTTIKASTTNLSQPTGDFIFEITYSQDLNPSNKATQNLTVTVTKCVVDTFSLSFSPVITTTILRVGVDPQPRYLPFTTTQTPACNYQAAFSFTTSQLAFVTLETLTVNTGRIVISGATNADHSTNLVTLKADVDGPKTAQVNITISISNPCSTTAFETSPAPLQSMTILLPDDQSLTRTQSVKIWTVLERSNASLICPITAILTPSDPSITLSSDFTEIQLSGPGFAAAFPASVKTYAMTLTVNSRDFSASVSQKAFTFNIVVTCIIQSLTFNVPALTKVFVGVDSQPFDVAFTLTKTPSNCPQVPSLTVSTLASIITKTVDPSNLAGVFRINQATLTHVDSYSIAMTATANSASASSSFTIEIVDPCSTTIFETSPAPLQNMSIQLPDDQSLTRTQPVKIWTLLERSNASLICPITATLTPSDPSITLSSDFTAIQVSGLVLTAAAPASVKTYAMTLTVNSRDFSASVSQKAFTFNIVVTCIIQSLTFNVPALTKVFVGVDSQPFDVAFTLTKTPNCPQVPSLTVSTLASIISKTVDPSNLAGVFTIDQATLTHVDSYSIAMTATADSASASSSFTIEIVDPCSTTIFETSPAPLQDMFIQLPDDQALSPTQSVKIWTVLERSNQSLVCPITAILTPSDPSITLSSDFTAIQLSGPGFAAAAPASVKTYAMTLTVNSRDFSASVSQKAFTFNIVVTCIIQSLSFNVPALTKVFVGVDSQPFDVAFTLTKTPNCPQVPSLTVSTLASIISKTVDPSNLAGVFTIDQATLTHVDSYSIAMTATGDSASASSNFTIEIVDPCSTTIFETSPAPLQDMFIQLPDDQALSPTQSVKIWTVLERSNASLICPITAILTPSDPSITLASDFTAIQLSGPGFVAAAPASVKTYAMTLTVNSRDFSASVSQKAFTFNIVVTCIIQSLSFNVPALTKVFVGVDSQPFDVAFTLTKTPPYCPQVPSLTVSTLASIITKTVDPSNLAGVFTIDQATLTHVDTYSIAITASADSASASSSLTIEIVDPCSITIFETSPAPLQDMSIQLPEDQALSLTQIVKIWTVLERSNQSLVCPIMATLTPSEPSITLSGDFTEIRVSGPALTAAAPASVKTHAMTLTVNSRDFPTSVPEQTFTFNIVVTCNVQSLTFDVPALTRIFVGVDSQPYDVAFALTKTPNCPQVPSLTVSTLASIITKTVSPGNLEGVFTIDQATLVHVDTYSISMTATADSASASSSFTIEIVDPCSETTFVTSPAPLDASYPIQLARSTPEVIPVKIFTAVEELTQSNVVCPISATLAPSQPFVSLSGDFSSITIDTAYLTGHIPESVQRYVFSFTVHSRDHIAVPQAIFSFAIDVSCLVTAIAFNSPPLSTLLRIGIDAQPSSNNFSVTRTPACPSQVQFVPSQALSFLQLQNLSLTSFLLTIDGASVSQHGTYNIELIASVGLVEARTSFEIHILDPCAATTFETNPAPLSDMLVTLQSSNTQAQTVKIYTLIERQHAQIVCPILAVLTPPEPFILLSADFTRISVDEAMLTSMIPGSVQTYQFTLTVNHSATYTSQVTQVQYTFNLVVSCLAEEVRLIQAINGQSFTYEIDPAAFVPINLLLPVYEVYPCLTSTPYTRSVQLDPPGILPAFVSVSDAAGTISISTTDPLSNGSYNFIVKAIEPSSGVLNSHVTFSLKMTCTITSFFNLAKNVFSTSYTIPWDLQSPTNSMPLPVYGTTPAHCYIPSDVKFELTLKSSNKLTENFIWIDSNAIKIKSVNPKTAGEYQVKVTATDLRYGFVDSSVTFNVIVLCEIEHLQPVYTPATVFSTQYEIGGGTSVTLPLPSYSWTPQTCKAVIEHKLVSEDGQQVPPFMLVDLKKMTVSLVPLKENDEWLSYANKELRFRFVASAHNGRVHNSDYSFLVKTIVKTGKYVIVAPWSTSSGDYDRNQTNTSDVGTLSALTPVKTNLTNQVSNDTNSTSNETLNENTSASLDLASENSTSNVASENSTSNGTASSNMTALETSSSEVSSSVQSEQNSQVKNQEPNSSQSSQSSDEQNQQDKSPSQWSIPDVKVPAIIPLVATKKLEKMPVKPKSSQLPQKGQNQPLEVLVKMSDFGLGALLLFSAPLDFRDFQDPTRLFKVSIEPRLEARRKLQVSPSSDVLTNFTWSLQKESETTVKLEVTLNHPESISQGNTVHLLIIEQANDAVIKSSEGVQLDTKISFSEKLNGQIKEQDVQTVEVITKTLYGTVAGSMAGSFLINLLSTMPLTILFGMIGGFQLILYFAILNVNFPGNANAVFKWLLKVFTFDFVPDRVMQPWYDIVQGDSELVDVSDQFNQRFDQMGYSSSNWVINLGSAIIFVMLVLAQMLILPIFTRTRLLDSSRFKAIRLLKKELQSLENSLYWNQPVRLFIELFFELALITAIRVKTYETGNNSDMALTYTAVGVLCFLVALNYAIAYIAIDHKGQFKHSEVIKRFGTLYEDIDVSVPGSYYNVPIFMLCRMMLVIVIIYLQDFVHFQLAIVTWITLAQAVFALQKPLESKLANTLEIVGQIATLVICDFFFQLTDNVPKEETRYLIGWIIIGLVMFPLAINLLVVNFQSIKKLVMECYMLVARRKASRKGLIGTIARLRRSKNTTHFAQDLSIVTVVTAENEGVQKKTHATDDDVNQDIESGLRRRESRLPDDCQLVLDHEDEKEVRPMRPLSPDQVRNLGQRSKKLVDYDNLLDYYEPFPQGTQNSNDDFQALSNLLEHCYEPATLLDTKQFNLSKELDKLASELKEDNKSGKFRDAAIKEVDLFVKEEFGHDFGKNSADTLALRQPEETKEEEEYAQ